VSAFENLIAGLRRHDESAIGPVEAGIVTVHGKAQAPLYLANHEDRWLVLYHEFDAGPPCEPPDNVFGRHWPAHVLGRVDGLWVLWSQQPLAAVDADGLASWLGEFAASVEHLRAAPGAAGWG
jgi:hypothetical protein